MALTKKEVAAATKNIAPDEVKLRRIIAIGTYTDCMNEALAASDRNDQFEGKAYAAIYALWNDSKHDLGRLKGAAEAWLRDGREAIAIRCLELAQSRDKLAELMQEYEGKDDKLRRMAWMAFNTAPLTNVDEHARIHQEVEDWTVDIHSLTNEDVIRICMAYKCMLTPGEILPFIERLELADRPFQARIAAYEYMMDRMEFPS